MPPFIKFLDSARRLIPMGMTRQQIFNFAKQEFGEVNELMKKQINNLFKPKKPVGKKDPDFDNTVEKMVFDDEGKPFNPRNPLKKADGGIMRAGFASGGDYKMRIQEKAEEIAEENYGKDFYDLSGSMQSKIYERAIREIEDMFADQADMMRKGEADGGRIGLKEGEGIMQMAGDLNPDSEADDISREMFGKPYKDLTPDELEEFREEIERLRNKFVSAPDPMDERNTVMENIAREEFGRPLKDLDENQIRQIEEIMMEMDIPYDAKKDRGAPSITLADGGRAAFKEGLRAKLMKPFKIDRGTLRSMFFNKNNPIISGFNTSELFDLVSNLSSLPGLAEGGRIGYKDGPKDPKRRTFMKAAAGLASLLPFGMGKISKVAAPVVTKAAEISGPALAKIVDTVMSLGKLVSVKGRRVKEMVTKKKHEGVEVTEDVADQSYIIKKGDKEIYYKPGKQDESGGFDDDIIEVIEKRIQKAGGGGIGYMLGE